MTISHFKAARRLFNFRVPQATAPTPLSCGTRALQLRPQQKPTIFWQPHQTLYTEVQTSEGFAKAKANARIDPSGSNELGNEKVVSVMQISADWCGPCRVIKPNFKELSAKHPDVQFYYVDIDVIEDPSPPFDVKTLPTFLLFLNGKLVDSLEGVRLTALKEKLKAGFDDYKHSSTGA